MNDINKIKEILSNHTIQYDHNDWIKLEKALNAKLVKKATKNNVLKYSIISACIIISSLIAIYSITQYNKTKIDNSINYNNTNNLLHNTKTEEVLNITSSDSATSQLTKEINKTNHKSKTHNISKTEDDIINIIDQTKINNTTISNISETNSSSSPKNNTTENINTINNENNKHTEQIIKSTELDLEAIDFIMNVHTTCVPAKINLSAKGIPAGYTVNWQISNNKKLSGNNVDAIYYKSGTYTPKALLLDNNNNIILKRDLNEILVTDTNNLQINFDNINNIYTFACSTTEELKYLWIIDGQQFDTKEISYEFNNSGNYFIQLKTMNTAGCSSEIKKNIKVELKSLYYLPNAFTPNVDGVNSEFGPIGENLNFESYQILIIDSKGFKVFSTDNPNILWNGKLNNNGEDLKAGCYFWEIKTIDKFGNMQTKKGKVNLLRN